MCKYHNVTKIYSKCTKDEKHQVTKKNFTDYCGGESEVENCPNLSLDNTVLLASTRVTEACPCGCGGA